MRSSEEIRAEITARMGSVPAFFTPAEGSPGVLEKLWQQTLASYLDNPLPALLKEKLFAYLSRYCSSPYALVHHSCALRRLGMTSADVLTLLQRPAPRDTELEECLRVLTAAPVRSSLPQGPWPGPHSLLEESILRCSVAVYLHHPLADRCHSVIRRLLGERAYSDWVALVAYVRTCHVWLEAHEGLALAVDPGAAEQLDPMLSDEPRLGTFFHSYAAVASADQPTGRPRHAVLDHAHHGPGVAPRNGRLPARDVAAGSSGVAAFLQPGGLISVCAWCNRVRDQNGAWRAHETGAWLNAGVPVSHGICPACEAGVAPADGG